ncbi:MAG: DUF1583 domain-containing protein [Planctomycetaceae bacterium]
MAVWRRHHWQTLGTIVVWLAIGVVFSCAVGDEKRSEDSEGKASSTIRTPRVAELFERDVLSDNIVAVRLKAKQMPVEPRYEYLRDWVLPSKSHRDFRLAGKQTQTDPVVPMIDDHSFDSNRLHAGVERGERRIHTGGNQVSPALDLIETARELGKLDELRFAVQVSSVSGEVQERCRLSMLAMIAITKGDQEAARLASDQLYNRFLAKRFPSLTDRMPETLLVSLAVDKGMLLDESLQYLVSMQDSQIRRQNCSGPTEWNRLITSLIGRIQHRKVLRDKHSQPWNAAPDLKSWYWATRIHSWGHGNGIPSGHIQLSDGAVKTLAYMDDEFLFFASPLRGNYSLECDCTGFGWKEIFPFVAGSWITPAHDHKSVQVGELYRIDRSEPVDPKLTRVNDWIHFRVDVRDGVCSRFINSRRVCEESLPEGHDPWVAFRNPGGGNGNLRNVRITGDPVIPDEVAISEHRTSAWTAANRDEKSLRPITQLHGWVPWDQDPWYPEKLSWNLEEDSSGATEIVGRREPQLAGTFAERLLRYHWPIFWNSQITYEFFHREGEALVHPAIGRRALLLGGTGVQNHWVTNSVWDLTTLDPLNASHEGNRIAVTSLPLRQDAWNQLSMNITDDTLALSLNGVPIFEGELEPTNDRTFGLFYHCDQSEARVRNVVLKGDWPKKLPPTGEQELRGTETDELDREREALADSFEFDFTKTNEKDVHSKFAETFNDPTSIALQADGLHMSGMAESKGQSTSLVGPRMAIAGDFDVVAEFSDLELSVSDNGSCAIYLGPRVVQQAAEAHLLYRGMVQHPDTPLREMTQVEVLQSGPKGFRYSYPAIYADECRSGRLRVARRGTRFHYLIAPLDSEHFRLLHSMEVSDVPLLSGNFMMRTSCYSAGTQRSEVSVVWKSLSVRADSIEQALRPGTAILRSLYVLDLPDSGATAGRTNAGRKSTEKIRLLAEASHMYPQLKWPEWSPDGRSIVYEMNNGQTSILVNIEADTQLFRSVGVGTLPSFSPDGSEVVTTIDGQGVSIMSTLGGHVAKNLDPAGLSGQWSPDGRFIAWIANKRIVVLDVKTQQRLIIPDERQPLSYRSIEKGIGWSHDSKSLAFRVKLKKVDADAAAIVVADLDTPDKLDVLYTALRLHSDVSWHPDGNQILFSGLDSSTGTPQMFIIKRDEPKTVVSVPGQPRNWRIIDCDWSPDGQRIAFTAELPQEKP